MEQIWKVRRAMTIVRAARFANREVWTQTNREHTGEAAAANWSAEEITWGLWGVREPTSARSRT
jgi:hypothetical protein